MPLVGQGFFASNAGAEVFIMNIVFNYIWAILAGLIYKKLLALNNLVTDSLIRLFFV